MMCVCVCVRTSSFEKARVFLKFAAAAAAEAAPGREKGSHSLQDCGGGYSLSLCAGAPEHL